jgi:hypothetical protein
MIDKANELLAQCSLCVSKAGEPKWERVLTEQGILEIMRRLPVVVEESLRSLKQFLRSTTGKLDGAGRAFKGPDEVLDHMLRSHLAPEGRSILSEASNAVGEKVIEERFSELAVIDVKGNCSHAATISFLGAYDNQ